MQLRVRGPQGQATLSGVEPDTSVAEFQRLLADKTGVPVELQELRGGFPPRPIALPADAEGTTLSSLGVQPGDSLTVTARTAPPAAATAAPAAAAEAQAAPESGGGGPAAAPSGHGLGVAGMSEDEQLARAIAASLWQDLGPPPPAAAAPSSRPAPPRAASPSRSHPAPRQQQNKGPLPKGAPISVTLPDGTAVVRRIIDSDNSCLFNAVGYVTDHSRKLAPKLRQVITEAVLADPVEWNEAVLGKEPAEYCRWIQDSTKWGGAIELSILSRHFGREIAAFDIQTKRVDLYGQDAGYTERVMLIYDGLHYDAMAVSAFEGAPAALDVTILPTSGPRSEAVMAGGAQLVARAHEARQFTDTANFTLRCGVCQIGLRGEKEAVEHAKTTGHTNFSEY